MEDTTLSAWVRSFAAMTLPISPPPSLGVLQGILSQYLSHQRIDVSSLACAEEVLEQALKISVLVEYGEETIGWMATTDSQTAAQLCQLLSSEAYHQARQALGIDRMWIFLADPNFLEHYDDEDLYEKAPDPVEVYAAFPELALPSSYPECVVVKL